MRVVDEDSGNGDGNSNGNDDNNADDRDTTFERRPARSCTRLFWGEKQYMQNHT